MKRLLQTAVTALGLMASAVVAEAASFAYDHNGSRVRVDVNGSDVKIFYERPRSGLRGVGVRPGTLLFNGRVSNGYLDGMSRIFNANCGEVDYFVHGDFRAGRNFKLTGSAPVLSNMSCRIVNNTNEGPNANLVFTALGGSTEVEPLAPAPQQQVQRGCVKIVDSFLNVRVGPGASYGKIGELSANLCGIQKLGRCQQNWCLVQYRGTIGWVSMRYIEQ